MSNIDELSADERSELANLWRNIDELSADERSKVANLQRRNRDGITARLHHEGMTWSRFLIHPS